MWKGKNCLTYSAGTNRNLIQLLPVIEIRVYKILIHENCLEN